MNIVVIGGTRFIGATWVASSSTMDMPSPCTIAA